MHGGTRPRVSLWFREILSTDACRPPEEIASSMALAWQTPHGNAFVESESFLGCDKRSAGTPFCCQLVCRRVACHTLRPVAFWN